MESPRRLVPGWRDGAGGVHCPSKSEHSPAHNSIIKRKDFDQIVELLIGMPKGFDAAKVHEIRDFTP